MGGNFAALWLFALLKFFNDFHRRKTFPLIKRNENAFMPGGVNDPLAMNEPVLAVGQTVFEIGQHLFERAGRYSLAPALGELPFHD